MRSGLETHGSNSLISGHGGAASLSQNPHFRDVESGTQADGVADVEPDYGSDQNQDDEHGEENEGLLTSHSLVVSDVNQSSTRDGFPRMSQNERWSNAEDKKSGKSFGVQKWILLGLFVFVIVGLVAAKCMWDHKVFSKGNVGQTGQTVQPIAVQPTAAQPTAVQPTAVQPPAVQPTAVQSTAEQPTAEQPTAEAEQPTAEAEQPTAEQPTAEQLAVQPAVQPAVQSTAGQSTEGTASAVDTAAGKEATKAAVVPVAPAPAELPSGSSAETRSTDPSSRPPTEEANQTFKCQRGQYTFSHENAPGCPTINLPLTDELVANEKLVANGDEKPGNLGQLTFTCTALNRLTFRESCHMALAASLPQPAPHLPQLAGSTNLPQNAHPSGQELVGEVIRDEQQKCYPILSGSNLDKMKQLGVPPVIIPVPCSLVGSMVRLPLVSAKNGWQFQSVVLEFEGTTIVKKSHNGQLSLYLHCDQLSVDFPAFPSMSPGEKFLLHVAVVRSNDLNGQPAFRLLNVRPA